MRSRLLTQVLCLGLAAFAGASPPPGGPFPEPTEGPFNVVFILVDDIGVDQVGVFAREYEMDPDDLPCTPNIDSLATNGIRFTNAWSNPVCSPTRSMIMTGRPARETGMGSVTSPTRPTNPGLSPTFETLADLVPASAGAIGKWHMADETQGPAQPRDIGFDTFLGPMYNLSGPPQDGPGYDTWRKWDAQSCNPIAGLDYATAETTEDAIAIIEGFGSSGSFLWLAYNASHAPFHCPAGEDCPNQSASCEKDWCGNCGSDIGSRARAMTQSLDHFIGDLMTHVDFATTAVVFLGDNGTPGNATWLPFDSTHAKASVYQGGINVPLIIRPPDGAGVRDAKCNTLVSATDLYATIADYIGATPGPGVDSYSLRGVVESGDCDDHGRDYVYAERFSPTFRPDGNLQPPAEYVATVHHRAIRNATHKLIEKNTPTATIRELYRLYDPSSPDSLPHDPADLDYPGSDPLSSAFEGTPVPEPYTGDDAVAYDSLLNQLTVRYPVLPVLGAEEVASVAKVRTVEYGSFAPPIGGGHGDLAPATVSYFCDESTIEVGYKRYPNGSQTYRTFLEFDLCHVECAVPDEASILGVRLEIPVMGGAAAAASEIEVWNISAAEDMDDVSDYTQSEAQCETLFNLVGSTLYGSDSGWTEWDGTTGFCVPVTKTIFLDNIAGEIYDEMTDPNDKHLSLALTLTFPGLQDLVDLYGAQGSPAPFNDDYVLRVYYTPGQNPGPCPCPGGGVGTMAPEPGGGGKSALEQSYPNPFNPTTTIAYAVRERGQVTLNVYDVGGRLVRSLVNGEHAPGERYEVTWDGRDDAGRQVASGMYFYRLTVGGVTETKKMMLLK